MKTPFVSEWKKLTSLPETGTNAPATQQSPRARLANHHLAPVPLVTGPRAQIATILPRHVPSVSLVSLDINHLLPASRPLLLAPIKAQAAHKGVDLRARDDRLRGPANHVNSVHLFGQDAIQHVLDVVVGDIAAVVGAVATRSWVEGIVERVRDVHWIVRGEMLALDDQADKGADLEVVPFVCGRRTGRVVDLVRILRRGTRWGRHGEREAGFA